MIYYPMHIQTTVVACAILKNAKMNKTVQKVNGYFSEISKKAITNAVVMATQGISYIETLSPSMLDLTN